uniref:Type III-B CRISPR module RAMP protein Cmr6 n=1 Tax=Desulfacinum infernum TaxID=35837 RepID=A0A832A2J2_9BACT
MAPVPGMTRNLWNEVQGVTDLHPGLVFYRFLDPTAQGTDQFKPLREDLAVPYAGALLQRTKEHLQALQRLSWEVRCVEGRLDTRLAVGLGIPSPTENGLAMDHIHGIPIIPGSGLKGLCLDWAIEMAGLKAHDAMVTAIFGAQPPSPPPQGFRPKAGRAIFFDALPVPQNNSVPVELDIMNPHYGPYYSAPSANAPADYHKPNIIYFAVVPAGTVFRFALAVRPPFSVASGEPTAAYLADTLEQWLCGVLVNWGVGAKTRIGYGLFDENSLKAWS